MADDLLGRARLLAELLSARGITHAFIGGLAMNAWSIPVPDWSHVRRWAARFGVEARLEEALSNAGLDPDSR